MRFFFYLKTFLKMNLIVCSFWLYNALHFTAKKKDYNGLLFPRLKKLVCVT